MQYHLKYWFFQMLFREESFLNELVLKFLTKLIREYLKEALEKEIIIWIISKETVETLKTILEKFYKNIRNYWILEKFLKESQDKFLKISLKEYFEAPWEVFGRVPRIKNNWIFNKKIGKSLWNFHIFSGLIHRQISKEFTLKNI